MKHSRFKEWLTRNSDIHCKPIDTRGLQISEGLGAGFGR